MSGAVRAVVAMPLYNGAATVAEAIESLLSQTRRDFALVAVDDCSTDDTVAVVERYAALDDRLTLHRNTHRLGLVGNWKKAFELAVAAHPEAEFFAWASDHDVWAPRWLELLVEALEERPDATLAFPDVAFIEDANFLRPRPATRDTLDVSGRWPTLNRVIRGGLSRGNMVYGLFRVDAVRRAGIFRHVLIPDKLLVTEVALQGPVVRVPELLWYRRLTASFDTRRQRRSIFVDGSRLLARVPWPLVHAGSLAWNLGVKGTLAPTVPQREGATIAAEYLAANGIAITEKVARRAKKTALRRGRALRRGVEALQRGTAAR